MSTAQDHNAANAGMPDLAEKHGHGVNGANGTASYDHAAAAATSQRRPYDYGGNPLAHINTSESARLPAFGGEFQPGLYRPIADRKFANPAPLGLCGFALTTFLLSLLNLGTDGISGPNIVIGAAFAYGGLCQLLAGMWEMAVGNTFGATALSSYGGFWIGTAIILTPGGFEVIESLSANGSPDFYYSFGLYLAGWFIFTTLLLLLTLRSTVAFFFLFLVLDLAFLCLFLGYLYPTAAGPQPQLIKAGGVFGIIAAFAAWYNAFAGMADDGNSFFVVPVAHFPWSVKGRERRGKASSNNGDAVA